MSNLKQYFPSVYDGVYETDQIISAENDRFDRFNDARDKVLRNQYVLTADEQGIEAYERIFGILPNPEKENLEFRRQRILTRISMTIPFTEVFLRNKLDEMIGVGKYKLSIDYDRYEIKIEATAAFASWYHEINVFMGKIKPVNMVYVNIPYLDYGIRANETISAIQTIYNYRLGTKWALGQKPFADKEEVGVFKRPETPSITSEFLSQMAGFTSEDIDNVLINDELQITTFTFKEADQNKVVIEHEVPFGSVAEIKNIKLKKGDAVLSETVVYIPATESALVKHFIQFTEGV